MTTAEIQLAGTKKYESIRLRLMTVSPTNRDTLQTNLAGIMQNWSVANSESVGGGIANKSFSYFCTVCWLQGRHRFDRLGGKVPIGLTTSAYGGPDALKQYLNGTAPDRPNKFSISKNSTLWNAMVSPGYGLGHHCPSLKSDEEVLVAPDLLRAHYVRSRDTSASLENTITRLRPVGVASSVLRRAGSGRSS